MNRSVVRKRWSLVLLAAGALTFTGCSKKPEPPITPEVVVKPEEMGKTIHLVAGASSTAPGTVDKEKERAGRKYDQPNHLRWVNDTTVPQTIKFSNTDWIFMETYSAAIVVAPGAYTEWFTIQENAAPSLEHKYGVTPLLSGPPTEPSITADP